jgi:hypothetical protein
MLGTIGPQVFGDIQTSQIEARLSVVAVDAQPAGTPIPFQAALQPEAAFNAGQRRFCGKGRPALPTVQCAAATCASAFRAPGIGASRLVGISGHPEITALASALQTVNA